MKARTRKLAIVGLLLTGALLVWWQPPDAVSMVVKPGLWVVLMGVALLVTWSATGALLEAEESARGGPGCALVLLFAYLFISFVRLGRCLNILTGCSAPWVAIAVALWFAVPLVAWLLSLRRLSSILKLDAIIRARIVLIAIALMASFTWFGGAREVKSALGMRLFSGHVEYVEDGDYVVDESTNTLVSEDGEFVDEEGQTFYAEPVFYADHWAGKAILGAFTWGFLGACIGVPALTWFCATRAIERKKEDEIIE